MNGLVIVVLFIIIFMTVRGYHKGLIKMGYSLLTIILSFAITGMLAPVMANRMCGSEIIVAYISDSVNESMGIEDKMYDATEKTVGELKYNKKMNNRQQEGFIKELGLPGAMTEALLTGVADELENTGKMAAKKFSKYLCDKIACIIIKTLVYILVFIIVKIILRMFAFLVNKIDDIPYIDDISEIGGAVIGAMASLASIWLFFLLLVPFSGSEFGKLCYSCINQSAFLRFLYDNNLLMNWIFTSTANM